MSESVDVIIVGAGMAGLSAARALSAAGKRVAVYDKARQVGGRMATRRFAEARFDTGAQFFTVTTEAFGTVVSRAYDDGVVAPWYQRPANRPDREPFTVWRGASGMTDLPKWMADQLPEGVSINREARVHSIGHDGASWHVVGDAFERCTAPHVIVTAPIPQAIALLPPEHRNSVPEALRDLAYHPCIALLVTLPVYPTALLNEHGTWRGHRSAIDWIADNGTKGIAPSDTERAVLTIHADPATSSRLYDERDAPIAAELLTLLNAELSAVGDGAVDIEAVVESAAWQIKRWRYAQPTSIWHTSSVPMAPGLWFAGDAFNGPRVEGAFLSGYRVAQEIVKHDDAP